VGDLEIRESNCVIALFLFIEESLYIYKGVPLILAHQVTNKV